MPDADKGASVRDFEAPAFYADASLPFGVARVLPPAAFHGLAFHQMEDLAIWSRHWICVGTHDEIPDNGDLLPYTVGTHGLHVQRTATGLAARFNKAQHGGCRAVPVQCQTGSKTKCSFTSCGYSRDRDALRAGGPGEGSPEMHQYLGLRPERLLTAAVRSWGPMIFLSLDASPGDLPAGAFAPVLPRPFFDNARGQRLASRWLEVKANWKLLAPALLGGLEQPTEEENCLAGRVRFGDTEGQAAWFFPNLVLLDDGEQTCAIVLQPTAVGRTLCRIGIYGDGEDAEAATNRWTSRLATACRQAEIEQEDAFGWGTAARPETLDIDPPLQGCFPGAWMQQILARKVLSVSAMTFDLHRYQSSGRRP